MLSFVVFARSSSSSAPSASQYLFSTTYELPQTCHTFVPVYFQQLPAVKFCNLFVLITIQIAGVYGSALFRPSLCGKSTLGEGVEGGGEAFEAGAESGRVAADAEAEMSRHVEEASGDHGGFKFFAKQLEEGFGVAAVREAWEDHRAGGRAKAFKVAARIEELIEENAIRGEERNRAHAELLEMVESHDGEALSGMRGGSREEIVEEPH